jgi:hypothetical protein
MITEDMLNEIFRNILELIHNVDNAKDIQIHLEQHLL